MTPTFDINKLPLREKWQALRYLRVIRLMQNQHGSAKRRKAKKVERQNRRRGRLIGR